MHHHHECSGRRPQPAARLRRGAARRRRHARGGAPRPHPAGGLERAGSAAQALWRSPLRAHAFRHGRDALRARARRAGQTGAGAARIRSRARPGLRSGERDARLPLLHVRPGTDRVPAAADRAYAAARARRAPGGGGAGGGRHRRFARVGHARSRGRLPARARAADRAPRALPRSLRLPDACRPPDQIIHKKKLSQCVSRAGQLSRRTPLAADTVSSKRHSSAPEFVPPCGYPISPWCRWCSSAPTSS